MYDIIRARHIFGTVMIALAFAIIKRPFATIEILSANLGISYTAYAAILAMAGTIMILFRVPGLFRTLLTAPFVLYILYTVQLVNVRPTTPYAPVVLYMALYIMSMYFMIREKDE